MTTQGSLVDGASTKKCPFCAEVIRAEAIKCKHCGSALPAITGIAEGASVAQSVGFTKRVGGFWGVVLAIIAFGQVFSTCGLLMENQIGPAIVAAAIGVGLFWWARNAGGVLFPCPKCGRPVKAVLMNKVHDVWCLRCEHKIEMRPHGR